MNEEYILTPKSSPIPRINGPRVFGVRPGSPVLYTIPATGERPVQFSAEGLPEGLWLDAAAGRITGVLREKGEYAIKLRAANALGSCERNFKIIAGEKIALTPPMGWNSWNCWNRFIDQEKVRENAEAMVKTGLVHHGWSYINIDDTWQGERDEKGAIQPNHKFPDMKGLCDDVHNLGLKIGIYSTPWVKSFAGHIGSTGGSPVGFVRDEKKGWFVGREYYEKADASQWAEWGIDFLKYDWHPMDLESGKRMREALLSCGRDIVYNVTNSADQNDEEAWSQISEAYFLWRRQGDQDIKDHWDSVSGIGFRMHQWRRFAGPGHWNDPDMLVVGNVGWSNELRPCQLTPDEQYTHISLWCLLAAPLILGNDLTQMDDFTLSLLTNDEVLEVNQDPLGIMADRMVKDGDTEVWAKDMEDGSKAVGLFNRGDDGAQEVVVKWADLGITGCHKVRDLWRQQDLGLYSKSFTTEVNRHGVALLRVWPEEK